MKNVSKELVSELIKTNYSVGRTATFDYEYREVFLDKMNYAFILFDSNLEDWAELDLDFYESAEEHDNFLTRLSKDYQTIVLFGYSQTTTGDTRFLALENGQVLRSIYQKSYYDPHRILMENDFGEKLRYERNFQYPEPGQSIKGFKYLDFYEDVQNMFIDYGFKGEKRKEFDNRYLHVEYLR